MRALMTVLVIVAIIAVVLFFTWGIYIPFFDSSIRVGTLVLTLAIPFLLGLLVGFFMGRNSAKPRIKKPS
jgi:MFS-type transporter involved in bile tolerance (Atg22 family)